MTKKYAIGQFEFDTKLEAKKRCSEAANRGPMGSQLEGEDAQLATAILILRSDKIELIGERSVLLFVRNHHAFGTHSFYAQLSDGHLLDFSYYKAIDALKPQDAATAQ